MIIVFIHLFNYLLLAFDYFWTLFLSFFFLTIYLTLLYRICLLANFLVTRESTFPRRVLSFDSVEVRTFVTVTICAKEQQVQQTHIEKFADKLLHYWFVCSRRSVLPNLCSARWKCQLSCICSIKFGNLWSIFSYLWSADGSMKFLFLAELASSCFVHVLFPPIPQVFVVFGHLYKVLIHFYHHLVGFFRLSHIYSSTFFFQEFI